MKRIFTIALIASGTLAIAQPNEQVNTYNYLRKGELDKAQKSIDLAAENEKTSGDPKTFYYRGQTYQMIASTKKTEYVKLHEDPLGEAADAFERCLELDTKGKYTDKVLKALRELENQMLNSGATAYNEKKYEKALTAFQRTVEISEKLQFTDSLAIYYAGISASELKRWETAAKYFNMTTKIGYRGAPTYSRLAKVYFEMDSVKLAVETIEKGMARYPSDKTLMVDMTNHFLNTNDLKGAEKMLKSILENDPDNAVFRFYLASIYDKGQQYDNAIREYQRAIANDSVYFDAFYNLGALHYNHGVESFNLANNLVDQKKYEAEMKRANDKFELALPLLEKAHLLNDTDKPTMISLMQIYARTKRTNKYDAMSAKLNN